MAVLPPFSGTVPRGHFKLLGYAAHVYSSYDCCVPAIRVYADIFATTLLLSSRLRAPLTP